MQEVVKEKVIFAVNCGRQSRCPNTIRTKQKKKSVVISRAIDIEKSPHSMPGKRRKEKPTDSRDNTKNQKEAAYNAAE